MLDSATPSHPPDVPSELQGSPRSVSGTRTRSATDPEVGDLIGAFEVKEVLSSSETCVLVAQRAHGQRTFVLRVPSALALDEGTLLVENEARLLGLSHPNMARVLEVGRWRESPLVVREHVHGLALGTVLDALARRERRLEPELAVMIGLRLARALGALHGASAPERRGYLHGDLHPGNVLISRRGQVKLIDLGSTLPLAHAGGAPAAHPRSAAAAYAAPEHLGDAAIDERADIFSLGAIVAHLLSGHAPEPDHAAREWARDALEGEPAALARFVQACLDAEPAARPASARAFADGLARALPSASTWTEADLLRSLRSAPRREPVAGLRPSTPPPPPPGGPKDPRTISTPPAGLHRSLDPIAPPSDPPSSFARELPGDPASTRPEGAAGSEGSPPSAGSTPSEGGRRALVASTPPEGQRRAAVTPPEPGRPSETSPRADDLEFEPLPDEDEREVTSRTLLARALSDPGRSGDDLSALEVEGVADAPVPLFRIIAVLALAALLVLGGLAYAFLR